MKSLSVNLARQVTALNVVRFFFMLFIAYLFLVFKSTRVVFLLLSLEFLVLGVFFYLLINSRGFLLLFYIAFSVLSSVLALSILLQLIKSFGRDYSLF